MSFLATMNLWEKERTDSPVWKFYVLYIISNLVNPCAWWPCGIRTTVLFVGGCLPGKFQQVDSASATDSRRRLQVIKCQSHKIRYNYFFCHACKMGKSYVLASEIIFVVLMVKRVREKLH